MGGRQLRKLKRNFYKVQFTGTAILLGNWIVFSSKDCTVNPIKIKDWFLFSSKFAYRPALKMFPIYNIYPDLLIKLRKAIKVH